MLQAGKAIVDEDCGANAGGVGSKPLEGKTCSKTASTVPSGTHGDWRTAEDMWTRISDLSHSELQEFLMHPRGGFLNESYAKGFTHWCGVHLACAGLKELRSLGLPNWIALAIIARRDRSLKRP